MQDFHIQYRKGVMPNESVTAERLEVQQVLATFYGGPGMGLGQVNLVIRSVDVERITTSRPA